MNTDKGNNWFEAGSEIKHTFTDKIVGGVTLSKRLLFSSTFLEQMLHIISKRLFLSHSNTINQRSTHYSN